MSLFDQLAVLPVWLLSLTVGEWLLLFTVLCTLASAIAALTPTPKDDAVIAKLYKLIDLLALNFGRAKELPPIAPAPKPVAKAATKAKPKGKTMKAILLPILLTVALTGCSGTLQTKAVTSVAIACDTYAEVLDKATDLLLAGKLSPGQVDTIGRVNRVTDAVCMPDSPIDPAAAVRVVESAIATVKEIVQ